MPSAVPATAPDPTARPAAVVGTVVLAGVGLIGGSVGLGLQQRFLARRVVGFDLDPGVLDAARGLGIIDEAQLHAGPWLAQADLVVLAAPARSLVRLAREMAPFLRPDCVVTDVGSAKADVVAALTGELRFVGGHPMAGSERVGVLHADAALLENAVWVLTPTAATDRAALALVERLVVALGAHAIEVDPDLHDRLVATVSHVPYLAAVALTHLVAEAEERELLMLLAAGGFRDLTRVASGSPRMSRDMVVANRAAVRDAAARFGRALTALAERLDDPDALLDAAEAAKRTRDEVVIAVPDRPGQLARITAALGDAEVNVKDIEVLGIREAGGALRLAFETLDEQRRAADALRAAGYEARVRGNGG